MGYAHIEDSLIAQSICNASFFLLLAERHVVVLSGFHRPEQGCLGCTVRIELQDLLLQRVNRILGNHRPSLQADHVCFGFGQFRLGPIVSGVTVGCLFAHCSLLGLFNRIVCLSDLLVVFFNQAVGWLVFLQQLGALQFEIQQVGLEGAQ